MREYIRSAFLFDKNTLFWSKFDQNYFLQLFLVVKPLPWTNSEYGPNVSIWIVFQNTGHGVGFGAACQEEVPRHYLEEKGEKYMIAACT